MMVNSESAKHSPRNGSSLNAIISNRKAMARFLHRSTSIRVAMRERCKARVKESRGNFIQQLRNLPSQAERQKLIYSTFHEELFDFTLYPDTTLENFIDESLHTQNEMKHETLTAEEEWVMKEYDSLLADYEIYASLLEASVNEVVCPICQKDKMFQSTNTYIGCHSCGTLVHTTVSLETLRDNIRVCIDAHSEDCTQNPQFTLTPEEDMCLLMMCPQCNFLSVVI